jgi:hypothetical protein
MEAQPESSDTQVDWESRIADLNPRGKWKFSVTEKNIHPDLRILSYEASIRVPSSYDKSDKDSVDFSIHVQKFTRTTSPPKMHVIFLAGGPGHAGRSYDYVIERFLEKVDAAACYTIDHRGLGQSGNMPELSSFFKDSEIPPVVPFPLKHLTMHNAALDVGVLTAFIRSEHSWASEAKMILMGKSYGAQLAHQVVQLLPNTYDHAFFGGLPGLPSLEVQYSHQGLIEHCEQSDECRRLMGGNVRLNIQQAIKNVTTPGYNQCTDIFWGGRKLTGYSQGEIAVKLTRKLRKMILSQPNIYKRCRINTAQLALALIKATSDCRDPSSYEEKVLSPLSKWIKANKTTTTVRNNRSKSGDVVNRVIIMDTDYDFETTGTLKRPNGLLNLNVDPTYSSGYYRIWQELASHIKGMRKTVRTPIITNRTFLHYLSGLLDMITPPHASFAVFEADRAPIKSWLCLLDSDHLLSASILMLWAGRISESQDSDLLAGVDLYEIFGLMHKRNEGNKLPWSFKGTEYSGIWDQINSLEENPPMSEKYLLPETLRVIDLSKFDAATREKAQQKQPVCSIVSRGGTSEDTGMKCIGADSLAKFAGCQVHTLKTIRKHSYELATAELEIDPHPPASVLVSSSDSVPVPDPDPENVPTTLTPPTFSLESSLPFDPTVAIPHQHQPNPCSISGHFAVTGLSENGNLYAGWVLMGGTVMLIILAIIMISRKLRIGRNHARDTVRP